MRECEELPIVADRLELDQADVEHLAAELGCKIVENRGRRWLNFGAVCKILRHIDRAGETRWRPQPREWARGSARGVR